MDNYTTLSYAIAEQVTKHYSTSFSMSSRLFDRETRRHIYAIYGLVRTADEIVDSKRTRQIARELDAFEAATEDALQSGYSANPVIHAFVQTAREFDITPQLTRPFFTSMRRDTEKVQFSPKEYTEYIYGSAEVVGLMCLKVFTKRDATQYDVLLPGARALGAAYQKVNFLRDISNDMTKLGRIYFPGVQNGGLIESQKDEITADIARDFATAETFIERLPSSARRAVRTSFLFYKTLFEKLKRTSSATLMEERIRVGTPTKLWLFVRGCLSL